jgi:hypothetical protein
MGMQQNEGKTSDGTYGTELIEKFGHWKDDGHLPLETVGWAHWHNSKFDIKVGITQLL